MKTPKHASFRALLLFAPLALLCAASGCDEPIDPDKPEVELDDEDLQPRVFGDASYEDCSSAHVGFNEDILRHGRIVAGTDAFAECIDAAFRTGTDGFGPYRACNGEPFSGSSIDTQIARAIDMARSPNDLAIDCTGGGGNASTGQNDGWGHSNDEGFSWAGWFTSVYNQLALPVCSPGQDPATCRFAAYPWPYSQAAGIVWHEASHTHGYSHGANDQANAIVACGYAGDPSWNFQVNTAPYIIGNCMSQVMSDSASACGNIDTCPGDGLRIVDAHGGATCSCVEDPAAGGFATFEVDAGEFDDIAHAASGTIYGSWNFNESNDIVGTGDFDGDGKEEVLVKSPWGIGILGRTNAGGLTSEAMHPAGQWIGSWNFGGQETIEAVGDFDADGVDEFVIRSAWGLGIMQKSGTGFSLVWSAPFNSWLGSYYLRGGDQIVGTGRFQVTSRDDLLLRGQFGTIGILRLNGASVLSTAVNNPGNWMGGWNHAASNTLHLPADYDGDGLDELVIRSNWGLAILERLANGALTTIEIEPFGTLLTEMYVYAPGNGWTLATGDQLVAAGDMNTDGKAELVVRNADGLGLLTLDGANQWRTRTRFFHGAAFSGGWMFGAGDQLVGLGDFDGLGGKDLVIRSAWGLGVISLRWYSYTLIALAADHYASMLDGWYLESGDVVVGATDLDGTGVEEILLQRQ